MKKIAFYIDGQNTYYALKSMDIKRTSKYNYGELIKYLESDELAFTGYYVGQVRRYEDAPEYDYLYQGQQKLLSHLQNNVDGIEIIKGKIMRIVRPDSKCTEKSCPIKGKPVFYEKGVDVRMAIDIVHDAIKGEYDEAFVLSSDTDLIPAIQRAQEAGKIIHYVGFQKQKSTALMAECDITRILTEEECKKYEYKLN